MEKEREVWVKVKNGKLESIKKPTLTEREALLDQGYTVSQSIEEGNKTRINTFSPLTKEQAYARHKKLNPIGRF